MPNKMKSQDKNNKISEIDEHIRRKFDILKRLGKGAYGIVWKAIDKRMQQTVAVKKIFDAFRNETDAQRTFREIMLLRALRNHPNIIQLHSIHRATNHLDIYLSFEFMESDLHNVIKRGSILKDIHKRYVMYQLLNATNFIHSGNIIHRDLKPSNILVDSKCRCKLADFGLARSLSSINQTTDRNANDIAEQCLTDYVATRWYRAPEILIANKNYTKGIDMWSLGCILGEMCRGKPLFPGSCTINQIECIRSALPDLSESDIKSVGNCFGSALLNQSIKPNNSHPSMDELLADSSNDAKQLIKALLVLDSSKRLTAKEALCHKYVERFRNTSHELELTADIVPPFRDDIQLSVSEYRSKLYEIMSMNEKKKISTPSSSVHEIKTTPTESVQKKSASQSNSRTILPKSIARIDYSKKVQTKHSSELNYSLQKCQNDAKPYHSSYLSAYHAKMSNNAKPTSSSVQNHHQQHQQQPNQQNQIPSKQLNGSYGRMTNELNCCKSCVRNGDESNIIKKSNGNCVPMPKLKNDTKSQQIDSNSSSPLELEHSKYKLSMNSKQSIISATFRRNSMDANAIRLNSTYKRSFDDEHYFYNNNNNNNGNRTGRQSFDDGAVKETTNQKLGPKASPPQLYQHNQHTTATKNHRNGNGNISDNCYLSHLVNNNSVASNDNRRLIKQMSLDEYTNATSRLRKLEMKMRKHKIDVLKYVNGKEQSNGRFGEQKKLITYHTANHFRTKLDPFVRNKPDSLYPKLGFDSKLQNKTSNLHKSTLNGSYGIISAADLYKLRATSTAKYYT